MYSEKTADDGQRNCPKHVEFYSKNKFGKLVQLVSENLYDIYHCCVYSEKTADDGQRNCPKHVEFYSENKFEKLVQLVSANLYDIYHCCVYSEKLLMMDRGTVRNM